MTRIEQIEVNEKCRDCNGTGEVRLLTSFVPCGCGGTEKTGRSPSMTEGLIRPKVLCLPEGAVGPGVPEPVPVPDEDDDADERRDDNLRDVFGDDPEPADGDGETLRGRSASVVGYPAPVTGEDFRKPVEKAVSDGFRGIRPFNVMVDGVPIPPPAFSESFFAGMEATSAGSC